MASSVELMIGITKVSLTVALVSSLVVLFQNDAPLPFKDPWFVPVVFVLLWESYKYDK
jgi:hypothetical protein